MKRINIILILLIIIFIVLAVLIFINKNKPDTKQNPQEECKRVNGVWRTFGDGCVDSCELERNPELIYCTEVLTDSCDCGHDRCWNGKTCEEN